MNFNELGLSESILDGLRDVGFSAPTKIQEESIIPVLSGRDIIASSETGTGKTGAFVIPILEKLTKSPSHGVKCLILTPTRELANQIDIQVTVIGYYSGITSATVFGGTDGGEFGVQERALRSEGANIIIATPGRLLDHIKMGHVDFTQVEFLVLDEADRMLDMGFMPDVQKIVSKLPEKRQNILFSATIPDTLNHFFNAITNDAVRVDCSVARTAKGIIQYAYKVSESARETVLVDLLAKEDVISAIVFTRTKRDADHVFKRLMKAHIDAGVIHGDREQSEREMMLASFKSGKIKVLVATDVLARGIDVTEVSHVFNFQVPEEPEDYIHRIGRTARAEAKGTAVTLVGPRELRAYDRIKKHVQTEIIEVIPDGIGSGPSQEEMDDASSGSYRRNDRRKPSRNEPRSRTKAHHSLETATDVESSTVDTAVNEREVKKGIRTSTTSRKEQIALEAKSAETSKSLDLEETKAPKSVRHGVKKASQRVAETETETVPTRAKRDSRIHKNGSDSEKPTRKPKTLTKRDELQRRFDAVDEKVSFFDKIKRFFGFGKK